MFVTWSGLLHAGKQHLADIKHMAAVCVQLRPSPRLAHAASLAMGRFRYHDSDLASRCDYNDILFTRAP